MGHQITFIPPKEVVDEKLKPLAGRNSNIESEIKTMVLSMAIKLMNKTEGPLETEIRTIKFNFKWLYELVKQEMFQYAVARYESDKEIWYCGWNYSHDECEWNLDDLIENDTSRLMIIRELVRTPDWFEESEKFYEKWNEIEETINGFVELCEDIAIYEIMEILRPWQEKYDEEGKLNESNEEFEEESTEE